MQLPFLVIVIIFSRIVTTHQFASQSNKMTRVVNVSKLTVCSHTVAAKQKTPQTSVVPKQSKAIAADKVIVHRTKWGVDNSHYDEYWFNDQVRYF